jgi:hypothetical protein
MKPMNRPIEIPRVEDDPADARQRIDAIRGVRETRLSGQTRRWESDLDALFELLRKAERDNSATAAELLARIRQLRETVDDLPDPALRSLMRRLLDEIWEAARAAVYGDLELVRERTARAYALAQRVRELLARLDSEASADLTTRPLRSIRDAGRARRSAPGRGGTSRSRN